MIYNFTTKDIYTLKMKLYMTEATSDTHLRFINANGEYMTIMRCVANNIYQEKESNVLGQYITGWNDVEITVNPVQKIFSFKLNDNVILDETTGKSVTESFFNYDIASFKVIKTDKDTTVAIDDFSITTAAPSNVVLDWDGTEAKRPKAADFANTLTETYATDALGDTTKGSSLVIGNGTTSSPMLQLRPSFGNVTGNTAFSYSFDLGINQFSTSRDTMPSYYFPIHENSKSMGEDDYGLQVAENGKITFFGTATDMSLTEGVWHNIKYVMASNGANTKQNASLYIDGEYVTSATLRIWQSAANSTIDRIRFYNNSTSSTMYIDNVKLERLETPTITSTDSTIAQLINTSNYQIYGYFMPGMTAGEFLEKTTGAVVKKDGANAAADVMLNDCDIYSTTANGELIKWENITQVVNKDIVAKQTFDSLTATDVTVGNSADKWCSLDSNSYLTAGAKCATISMCGGIADKAADDKCVLIKGDNIATSKGADPFVKLTSSAAGALATTLDVQIYMEGDSTNYIQAVDSNNSAFVSVVFNADGTVSLNTNPVVGFNWKTETENSKWMNVSLAVNAMLDETTLIINNKIVGQLENASAVSSYKFLSLYSIDSQSGLLAIDNLHFYEGFPEDYAVGKINVQKNGTDCAVTVDVEYADSLPLMLIVAEYDSTGRCVDVAFTNETVSDSKTVEFSKTLKNASNAVKAFAWNPNNLQPYVNCGTTQIQ